MNVCTPYSYKNLQRTELDRQNLKIDEVTIGVSPSTGTSLTIESAFKSYNKSRKMRAPMCQVRDLNLGWKVPPQGTQLANL
jgi:hypothetical protein